MINGRRNAWLVALGVTAMLAGGFVPARAGVSDAWVSTKVKMLLMNSPRVAGFPIDVDTDGGRVTLHGKVSENDQKVEAGRIARAGTGVLSVRNLLQVVPESRRKAVEVADDRLTEDVNATLKSEVALANSSIRVKSMNKGVALLEGKAASLSDHLLALELASSVAGVKQVASEVDSPDEYGDREVWFETPPNDPVRGNAVTDGWITAQTKMKFMTDEDVPSGDINVDTRRGVVTLFGTVPTSGSSEQAVRLAKAVPGVQSVNSQLQVVPAAKRGQAIANDNHIQSAVRKRIADAGLEGSKVRVDVKASVAHLTGTVERASDRYAAVAITHATPGVIRVWNELRVEATQTSQR